MNKSGPLIIIEYDLDDQQILQEIFSELKVYNDTIFFDNGHIAYDYLLLEKE